jgi:AbrB family looped-hinge helix DNA binding protein
MIPRKHEPTVDTTTKRYAVSSDGRITIPAKLRRRLKLRPGTIMSWKEENHRLILISIKQLLDEIQGSLKPRPGEPSMSEMLLEERKRERIREERER